MPTKITGINTISPMQLKSILQAATPMVSNKAESSRPSSGGGGFNVSLSAEAMALQQTYNSKKNTLEEQHSIKKQRLESEYNQKKRQLEQEYRQKENSLGVNIYT